VKVIDEAIDRINRFQQSHRTTAVIVAVQKAYGDHRGGMLTAAITFYGFVAVFPLLLLFFTVVALVLSGHPALQERLINAALSEFPDLGSHLSNQIHALRSNSPAVFAITALTLFFGGLGIASALQQASSAAWGVDRRAEPDFWHRMLRNVQIISVVASTIVLSTALTGLLANRFTAGFAATTWFHGLELVAAMALNLGGYAVALKILSPTVTPWRTILPGAILGGCGWALLQAIGTSLVAHHLHRGGALYGVFAVVLALVFWINLGTRLFLYATELNVVLQRRAWPRSFRDQASEG